MNFFKRATTSILRRPGKSVILLLLIFILGTVISGALAVEGAVSNTEENLRRGMRPIVTFERDWEGFDEYIMGSTFNWDDPDAPQMGMLTPDHVRDLAALPQVQSAEYSVSAHVDVETVINHSIWMDQSPDDDFQFWGGGIAWLQFRGTGDSEPLQVREGLLELVDGRLFTDIELTTVSEVNPALVSAGFARVNGLSVHDTFDIPVRLFFPQMGGMMWDEEFITNPDNIFLEEVFTFEVIGLVDAVEEADFNDMSEEGHAALNRIDNMLRPIHVSNAVAETMQRFHADNVLDMHAYMAENDMEIDPWALEWLETDAGQAELEQVSIESVMILEDPLYMDDFIEAAADYLPDFWRVEPLAGGFDAISTSMETLQDIAGWVLWVSIGATLLILSLLITLFLRDRRHEMGVYLALGEKKGKIISQILLEVVVTAVVAITLAVFTGNMISGMMSQNMLQNEIANAQGDRDPWGSWSQFDQLGFNNEMSAEDMMEAFDISISIETIGIFYAVGLGAVILSTFAPVIYVVTLNPKKVLM
ncbi:MAG: FtsX-like permease family protein [Turicibacter sp.]|nr:FtsX-like permease family protein [Turicibacter sp.]